MGNEEFMTDPEQLRAQAQQEPPRRGLEDYREAIRVLKEEKGFTLREIAEWLRQRGMNVDHNAVWRAYTKGSAKGGGAGARYGRAGGQAAQEEAMPWLEES